MNKIYFLLFSLFISINGIAQIAETESTMLWTSLGVRSSISDKFRISYDQLHSFSLNSSTLNFIQPDLKISYDLAKRVDLSIGYSPTFSLDGVKGNQLLYHRVSSSISVSTKISQRIRMKNSFTAEYHFTQRSKFQMRYYYRWDLYYRDTSLPWRLRPFINQKIYYYSNGKPVQYYSSDGEPSVLTSPNGLHAFRLKAGIKLYPFENFNFSIYYLKQKEFNSKWFGSKDLNIINPNSNTVIRRFYDFSVIGLYCSYNI